MWLCRKTHIDHLHLFYQASGIDSISARHFGWNPHVFFDRRSIHYPSEVANQKASKKTHKKWDNAKEFQSQNMTGKPHKYKDEPITDLEVSGLTCLRCFKFCKHKWHHRNDKSESTHTINPKFSYFLLVKLVMEKNCGRTYQWKHSTSYPQFWSLVWCLPCG